MAEVGNDVPRGLLPVLARLLVESDPLDGDLDRDRDGREDIIWEAFMMNYPFKLLLKTFCGVFNSVSSV